MIQPCHCGHPAHPGRKCNAALSFDDEGYAIRCGCDLAGFLSQASDDPTPELLTGGHATTLDMSAEQKKRAREREKRIEREGFGFARALHASGKGRRRKARGRS